MKKQRGLSKEFIQALKKGILAPLLSRVKDDSSLCLQIRGEGINIYYRGGSLLRISRDNRPFYTPKFDRKYFFDGLSASILDGIAPVLKKTQDTQEWVDIFPFLKHAMDLWFGKHPKEEREYQQLVVRENNFSGCAGGTDYFICDIEYATAGERFDMIAVCWPSSSVDRKKTNDVGLAFIEMKYGDSALGGKSGLEKHTNGMKKFLLFPGKLEAIKEEMKGVFNQMQELGIIKVKNQIQEFGNRKPEFILLLANHDPASDRLRNALSELKNGMTNLPFDFKFIVSNFMGYGLYKENVYDLDTFLNQFNRQI